MGIKKKKKNALKIKASDSTSQVLVLFAGSVWSGPVRFDLVLSDLDPVFDSFSDGKVQDTILDNYPRMTAQEGITATTTTAIIVNTTTTATTTNKNNITKHHQN